MIDLWLETGIRIMHFDIRDLLFSMTSLSVIEISFSLVDDVKNTRSAELVAEERQTENQVAQSA